MQVADAGPGLGDGLALDLEDEPEDAVRGGVLRPHVDDDPLLAEPGGVDDLVPVPAAYGDDGAFQSLGVAVGVDDDGVAGRAGGRAAGARAAGAAGRARAAGAGGAAHQEYCLRSSGGGTVAPLYSTGMPPRG